MNIKDITTNVAYTMLLTSFMFAFIFCIAIIAYMPLLALAIFFIVLSYFTGRNIRWHRQEMERDKP